MLLRGCRVLLPTAAAALSYNLYQRDSACAERTRAAHALAGKCALVTGSTSGIGQAIAEEFCAEGAKAVYLNGFGDVKEIEALRRQLATDYGVEVFYIGADMSNPEEIESMIKQIENEQGHLDILVNNAGIQYVAPVEEFPTERWDKVIAINMSSAFHTTSAAITGMKERGYGRIINVVGRPQTLTSAS
jgi:3-hydroxybutyrate dehydrogenase